MKVYSELEKTTYYPNTGNNFIADVMLPCPFCGSKPELLFISNDHTKSRKVEIKCTNTNCRVKTITAGITADHKQIALWTLEIWNRRVRVAPGSTKRVWGKIKE